MRGRGGLVGAAVVAVVVAFGGCSGSGPDPSPLDLSSREGFEALACAHMAQSTGPNDLGYEATQPHLHAASGVAQAGMSAHPAGEERGTLLDQIGLQLPEAHSDKLAALTAEIENQCSGRKLPDVSTTKAQARNACALAAMTPSDEVPPPGSTAAEAIEAALAEVGVARNSDPSAESVWATHGRGIRSLGKAGDYLGGRKALTDWCTAASK